MTTPQSGALEPVLHGEIVGWDPIEELTPTEKWLLSYRESRDTRDAYRRDVEAWQEWCGAAGINPMDAKRSHVDAYAAVLANHPNPHTERPLSPASLARKLSAISSWYTFLTDEGHVAANPVQRVRRPKVDKDDSSTTGLSVAEARAFLQTAPNDQILGQTCGGALGHFLTSIGARVSEICNLNIEDLGHDSGHRTVKLHMKGGKTRTRAMPPGLAHAVEELIRGRVEGPVFTLHGRRMRRDEVARFIRRTARAADIASWAKVTPHSFRHAWATVARASGATLEERQYALGHADPRTTQRYDRARASLDTDPSYRVAATLSQVAVPSAKRGV